ncbi:hypothetical protein [Methanolobus halotolerans]|uniref:Uncharacterized protein n=1 Tax=Methanolobus halotolerans TaxID=2052935 RepID=A0A4E0Q0D1_9EURY|nr:hypothetical protein [Methanolobus halotolerans]TGC11476.1 hypothetical protein CUN85_00960 [Methanolobus halotolerans]
MDSTIVIEKAIKRIADTYDIDVSTVSKAIYEPEGPLDLESMVDEGIFCFRGPDNEIKYDNASICLSNKILANKDVSKNLLSTIYSRVSNWDKEDMNVLLADLKRIVSIMELNPDAYPCLSSCDLDVGNLPSERIPDDIKGKYDVWAMDKKGMCLVGIDANKVIHIDDIRKPSGKAE